MAKKAEAAELLPEAALGPRPRLSRLIIKNCRCIGATPVTIDLDDIVVLVGPNNTGKSSVLKAYEVIMSEGSTAGQLSIEDFPFGAVNPDALPEIELHTIVYDNSPGHEWMEKTPTGEMLVRELWSWSAALRFSCTLSCSALRRMARKIDAVHLTSEPDLAKAPQPRSGPERWNASSSRLGGACSFSLSR